MRLRRIELPGFGCLSEFNADFAPGINVVFGLNEAGKSTLQQAICAMLYGFYDGERGKPDEKRRHERFRPWAAGTGTDTPYRGALEYELVNAEAYEVRRDYSTQDVETQLIDLSLGKDVAARFGMGRHGNVPFARRQLGMSRGVFQSCAFIAQGEIFEASQGAGPREIGDAIAAMADSARRDVSAAAALNRLDALMLRIGRDRARTAELPRARENLRAAEEELAALDLVRAAASERSVQLDSTQSRLEALDREIVAVRAQYLVARRNSLSRRLDGVREAEARLAQASGQREGLREFASFPADLRDRVVALADRRQTAQRNVEAGARDLEDRLVGVSEAERLEYEALRVSLGALTPESLERLEKAAYAVETPEIRPALVVRALRRVVVAIRALFRRLLRRRKATTEVPANDAEDEMPRVTREEALALLERHRRYLTLRPAVQALEQSEARLREGEQGLASVKAELSALVRTEAPAMDQAVAEFLEGCEKRIAYEAAAVAAREAEEKRDALLGGRSEEDLKGQFAECESRLEALLAANPEIEVPRTNEPTSKLRDRLATLEDDRHGLEIGAARLEEEIRAALGDQRARADIEEDVERWLRETARLERLRNSAQTAREVIDEAMTAVYRDFAPAVSSFLSEGFEYVTEGRYRRAHVDPATLEVSLLLPETDHVIKDPPVSRGTLALAYILMRIGLAQHMSAVAEPVPLVLDDPFVDLDGRRLERMLEFISRLSERMQVLLFTKEPSILRWMEANAAGGSHRVHMLSRLRSALAPV